MKHYEVVAAVVIDKGKILCAQRGVTRFDYTSLKYEFPGGKIEQGETPEEALRRELSEEMDYDVEVVRQLCVVNHTYPDFSITMQIFLCRPLSSKPTLKEHRSFCWLNPTELDSLDWAAADRCAVELLKGSGALKLLTCI